MTGASSGIGREIAILLARVGYGTVLVARRRGLLDALAAELSHTAPSVPLSMDLAEPERTAEALEGELRERSPIEVLVNCAGVGVYGPFRTQSPEDFRRLMAVNFDAAALLTSRVLPGMLEKGRGHVFNVCSVSARVGPWGHAAYAASKSALRSFTETLWAEHLGSGVRFTVVYPGIVRTPYFENPRVAGLWERVGHRAIAPDRVARAVVRTIGRERPCLYVPRLYRAIDAIHAASPTLALRLVRAGSRPLAVREAQVVCPESRPAFAAAT